MTDAGANMAAVTASPVTKGTAFSVGVIGKQGHRERVRQLHRQHPTTLQKEQDDVERKVSVDELRIV